MGLAAGRLRERIIIEEKNQVPNGRGGWKSPEGQPAWKTWLDDRPAEIIPLRGAEALAQGITRSTQIWRVTIRAVAGIKTSMRIRWKDPLMGEIVMDIRTAAPNDSRDGIVMTCESGLPS